MGVVLIIGPWNYPFQLVILPLIGAIAAGNCVVIKPSEIAPETSKWLATNLTKYLDTRIAVVEGNAKVTSLLLKQKWDHIFYTGSATVGKIVYQAAASQLIPATLELGGKCPVIVDVDCNLEICCKRIIMGKFLNMGQTCVAPDHIFVHESIAKAFTDTLIETITHFYGQNPQLSTDLSRIINMYVLFI